MASIKFWRATIVRYSAMLLLIATLFSLGTRNAVGEEPVSQFLAALRERGYFDLAIAYLNRVSSSDSLPAETVVTLRYEKGITLISAALAQRQLAGKERYLDQAQAEFEAFTKEAPQHALSLAASGKLGDILVERARIRLTQADRPSAGPEQQAELRKGARNLFTRANTLFVSNKKKIRKRLEGFPKALDPEKDEAEVKLRDQLRSDYVQAQFISAMVLFEKAQTYPKDSKQRKNGLKAAEDAFGVVATKYRRRLAGLSAVLFQARCRDQASAPKEALTYYKDLLDLPADETALRALKTKALAGAMACWLHADINQPQEAIKRSQPWLAKERPNERQASDWLRVKLLLAEAYIAEAQDKKGRSKADLLSDARRLAIEVAKQKGVTQSQAHELLAQLGAPTKNKTVVESEFTNFDAAFEAAKKALNERQLAVGTITLLQRRLPQIKEPENRQEVEERLAEAKQQLTEGEGRSLTLFKQAYQLADAEVPVEDLNTVRYYLCTLHYYQGNYYSAAVLGDFLARRFPASAEGRRAASVALASLVKLYGDGSDPVARQLSDRIVDCANFIATRWSGQPEAFDALSTLVTLAVQSGDLEQAEKYLQKISSDSPKRGAAEMAIGQALWNQSLQDTSFDGGLRDKAIELLTQGLKHTANDSTSVSRVAAALSLAQYHLDQGNTTASLELLENRSFGPKTLADQKNPAITSSPALVERAYVLDILAHIASLANAEQADDGVKKALAALDSLKETLGDDPAGQQRLSRIYVTLAKNLQNQISKADATSRRSLSVAFQQFLDQAAATTREVPILNWIADSYLTFGREMIGAGGQVSDESKSFFSKAADIYTSILSQADAGKIQLSAQRRLQTQNRLAVAYREMGDFRNAMEILTKILEKQETQVYVQFEAARTLQEWGDKGNPEAYLKAIRGDQPKADKNQNLIWGYGRIAKLVASSQKLNKLFHDCRYHLAESRYQYALQQKKAKRDTTLAQAKNDINATARFYQELGGAAQKAKYDQLLKRIQKALGDPPTGLKTS